MKRRRVRIRRAAWGTKAPYQMEPTNRGVELEELVEDRGGYEARPLRIEGPEQLHRVVQSVEAFFENESLRETEFFLEVPE